MSDARKEHWEKVYTEKAPDTVSWFQELAAPSLSMIASTGLGPDAAIIDVGAGASALVDGLLDRGFKKITVLDVSHKALEVSQARLGSRGDGVDWQVADITTWTPPAEAFGLWHDRAVFHFLIEAADRKGYIAALNQGLRSGGFAILAPFALSGPERCSGLPVQRYSPQTLQDELGSNFALVSTREETHKTPGGASQDFVWCLFRKA